MSLARFQLPYMTTAQRLAVIPLARDLVFDINQNEIFIGDGFTYGGQPMSAGGVPVITLTGDVTGTGNGIILTTLSISSLNGIPIGNSSPNTGTFTTLLADNFSGNTSGINTGDQTITLYGDISGSGTGTFEANLATVNANVGMFGASGVVPQITIDSTGRITSAANIGIPNAITLTGDITGIGSTSSNTIVTLSNTTVTSGPYSYANITVDSKGRLTSATTGSLPPSNYNPASVTITGGSINDTIIGNVSPAAGTFSSLVSVGNITANNFTGNSSGINTGDQNLSGLIPLSYLDTDGNLTANSDTRIATQKATRTYADQLISTANALVYKGVIDCSLNPNYPAADAGWLYVVSIAGKIGGVVGITVDAGDMLICNTDGTISGDQASVGTDWNVIEHNVVNVVSGPSSSVDGNVVLFNGPSGRIIKDSGLTLSGSNTGDQTITLIGNVTGSGTGSFNTIIASTGVVPGPYYSANITIGADGRITAAADGPTLPITEAEISLSNNSTNNATTARHGFLPILPNNAAQFLNGQGNYSIPAAGAANSYDLISFSGNTSVNVIHNFGTYPVVQVIDSTGNVLVPQSITNNSLNDFTVTFNTSTTGSIIASVGSPQPQAVISVSSNYLVQPSDKIIKVTSSGVWVSLPTSINNTGREYAINNASPGIIYSNCIVGGQTINNVATQTIPPGSTMDVYSDGANFQII